MDPVSVIAIAASLVTIFAFIYVVKMDYRGNRQNPDQELINYHSTIEINRKKIIEISNGEVEDDLQSTLDAIVNSYKNQNIALFKKLVKIHDSKWNRAFETSNIGPSQSKITDYFCEHYSYLIIQLIKKQADYESINPVLESFSGNSNMLLEPLKKDISIYKKEIRPILYYYFKFMDESIEHKNDAIFGECLDESLKLLETSIELNYDDSDIVINFMPHYSSLVQSACQANYDVTQVSVILLDLSKVLMHNKFFKSFELVLLLLENIITSNSDLYKKSISISDEDKNKIKLNIMFAERNLLYMISNVKFNLPTKCCTKIETFLAKTHPRASYDYALDYAFDKTYELVKNDKESCMNLFDIKKRLIA
ncbi:hypothetical protein [Methanococcoides sp.]|jgi:hypothetical protein|uniref:hypothetical protein n=1 Tax=Methanococcoides sp. TaxID=1966350 RepID=UPI00272E770C|nr:hypothetical protein [Methanococcoides sp.]